MRVSTMSVNVSFLLLISFGYAQASAGCPEQPDITDDLHLMQRHINVAGDVSQGQKGGKLLDFSTKVRYVCDRIPCSVTMDERSGSAPCSFEAENGGVATCHMESPEHELVQKYILANATVLELGARYGTTTCEIAAAQGNSGNLVAVEPDPMVWDVWKKNVEAHGCAANQLMQVVGNVNRTQQGENHYGTRFSLSDANMPSFVDIEPGSAVAFSEVERKFNLKFDTLLIDCEGCIKYFLEDNPGVLEGINTILLEADMGIYQGTSAPDCGNNCVNYDSIIADLQKQGFSIVEHFKENEDGHEYGCCPWIHHFALKRG
mmetsp:Transcript_19857/g.35746  ORF Transcript_19857/g.35746 Transcript_19857/m.35746 type:complete len:318 (+) Transcript_19857:57-1010(+)